MANVSIVIKPDPAVLGKKLEEFNAILAPLLVNAGQIGGEIIVTIAQSNMKFKNPTGAFEGSLQVIPGPPGLTYIGSDLPYGRRLEFGFKGTDSLGRNYNQSGKHFMRKTINNTSVQQMALQEFLKAIAQAWNTVAGTSVSITAMTAHAGSGGFTMQSLGNSVTTTYASKGQSLTTWSSNL